MGKISLHFTIQGDWMTQTSRTAYWGEGNFDYARELLGSLIGINEKQIDQILLGEKKLIGDSDGDGMNFVDDDSDFKKTKEDMVKWSNEFSKRKADEMLKDEQNKRAIEVFDYAEKNDMAIESPFDFDRVARIMNRVGDSNIKKHQYNMEILLSVNDNKQLFSQFDKNNKEFDDIKPLFSETEKEETIFDHTQEHLKDIEVPKAFNIPKDKRTIQDINDINDYYNKITFAEKQYTEKLQSKIDELNNNNDDMSIRTPFGSINENTTLEELEDISRKQAKMKMFVKSFKSNKIELPYGEPREKIDNENGWLSPDGMFYPMGFQTHNNYCYDIIEYEKDVFGKVFTRDEEINGNIELGFIGWVRISDGVLYLPMNRSLANEKQLNACLNAEYKIVPCGWDTKRKYKNKDKEQDWSNEIREYFDLHWTYSDAIKKKIIDKPYEVEILNDMFSDPNVDIIEDLKKRGAKSIKVEEKSLNGKVYGKVYYVGGENE